MTNETPSGLQTVLDQATDRIERPLLAQRALAEARRRRAHRHATVVAAAAVAAACLVGAVQLLVEEDDTSSLGPAAPSGSAALPEADDRPGESGAVQPRWDPFTIAEAPLRETVLPPRLQPPADAPSVADSPMSRALVAWPQAGEDLRLLGTDGTWRVVEGTSHAVSGTLSEVVDPALSTDGRQVAMSTNDGILVVDVTSGEQRTIPWPDQLAGPWDDAPGLLWRAEDEGFLVRHWRDTWIVDADGGARKAPYGGAYGLGLAVDPAGPVIEWRFQHRDLRVWEDSRVVSRAPLSAWGGPLAAGHGRAALVGGAGQLPGDGGPMVIDAETGELVAYAPIRDRDSVYTDNGHLIMQGFLDTDTVLLLVGPMDFRTMDAGDESWHLVAWDLQTGSFQRLATGDTSMRTIDVSSNVLASESGWAS